MIFMTRRWYEQQNAPGSGATPSLWGLADLSSFHPTLVVPTLVVPTLVVAPTEAHTQVGGPDRIASWVRRPRQNRTPDPTAPTGSRATAVLPCANAPIEA